MDTHIQGRSESIIMKILVTGGKGFIGSKIVEMLSNDGHKVTVVDNHDTYGIMTKQELNKLYQWRTRNWKAKNVSVIRWRYTR